MTSEQINAFRLALKSLTAEELTLLRDQVDEQIEDLYWCDENFWMRESIDSYIYITRYEDGSYYYDYLGQTAYERYISDDRAVQLDYKTKDLFPTFGTLMRKENHARQETV